MLIHVFTGEIHCTAAELPGTRSAEWVEVGCVTVVEKLKIIQILFCARLNLSLVITGEWEQKQATQC